MMNRFRRLVLTTFLTTMALFTSVVYVACNKESKSAVPDSCANVTCKNGGDCVQGKCMCLNGFEESDCGKRSIERMIGKWKVEETTVGSSAIPNRGTKRLYTMTIAEIAGSNVSFTISNFMDKGTGNIKGDIGLSYNLITKTYERDVPTAYVIKDNQTVAGTYITIVSGSGKVDQFGNTLNGRYYTVYPTDTATVRDTINFIASYIN
jgi:hypothetical protein